jgi:hypothetical protein
MLRKVYPRRQFYSKKFKFNNIMKKGIVLFITFITVILLLTFGLNTAFGQGMEPTPMIMNEYFDIDSIGDPEYTDYTPSGVSYVSAEGHEKQWKEYSRYTWNIQKDSILIVNRGTVVNLRTHLLEYILYATNGEYPMRALKRKSLDKLVIITVSLDPSFALARQVKDPNLRLKLVLHEIGYYSVVVVPMTHSPIQE